MTYVPDYLTPQPPTPGRGGLLAYGIVTILLGVLAGCMSLMFPAALFATPGTPSAGLAGVVVGMVMFIAIAVGFIWVGIGSCQCRRWVRPVVLCFAWPWLVIGTLSTILVATILRDMPMPPNTTMPAQVRTIMFVVTGVTMVVTYIILPLAYIVYYQRRNVQETLNLCDLHRRWTERCPMPVLGLSIWLLITALGSLEMLQYGCLPMFGTYLTGVPAPLLTLALAAALVVAARFCYRLRPIGWWIALLTIVAWTVSTILTFHFTGILEFYRHSGMPQDQLAFLAEQPFVRGHTLQLMAAVFGGVCTAYLLYVRRYFVAGTAEQGFTSTVNEQGH